MDFVRVRHPDTGKVSRIGWTQFDQRLRKRGFTLVEDDAPAAVTEPAEPTEVDALAEAVGDTAVADALRAAGYDSPATISAATDDELRAVKGVGPGRLARLRAYAVANPTTEKETS